MIIKFVTGDTYKTKPLELLVLSGSQSKGKGNFKFIDLCFPPPACNYGGFQSQPFKRVKH